MSQKWEYGRKVMEIRTKSESNLELEINLILIWVGGWGGKREGGVLLPQLLVFFLNNSETVKVGTLTLCSV